jgi:hypothetical protein
VNGCGSNAEKDDGRKIVHRKKKRKTPSESGFSGLVVSMLASGSRVQTRPKPSDFPGKKSSACLPSEGK